MQNYSIGDIFSVFVEFEEGNGQVKERPCVIVGIIEGTPDVLIMAQLTGQEPKNPPSYYDKKRIPVYDWVEARLKKKSYVKTDKGDLKQYDPRALVKFRGSLSPSDLSIILKAIYL
jgi:hypothetical protein